MKVYKDKSDPLEEVPLYAMVDKTIYVTEDGTRFKFEENKKQWDIIQKSELNLGEEISELTDKQLRLFWILMKNKGK